MDRRTGDLAVFNLPIDSKGTERPLTPGYGLGMESPVLIASEIEGPLVCFHDFRSVVAATGFEQQHPNVRIFGQTTGHDRARAREP
jgi:hypothetical protein